MMLFDLIKRACDLSSLIVILLGNLLSQVMDADSS